MDGITLSVTNHNDALIYLMLIWPRWRIELIKRYLCRSPLHSNSTFTMNRVLDASSGTLTHENQLQFRCNTVIKERFRIKMTKMTDTRRTLKWVNSRRQFKTCKIFNKLSKRWRLLIWGKFHEKATIIRSNICGWIGNIT